MRGFPQVPSQIQVVATRANAHVVPLSRRPVRRSFSEGGSRAAAKADRIVVLHATPLMRAIVDHVCDPKADRTTTGSKHLLAVFLRINFLDNLGCRCILGC